MTGAYAQIAGGMQADRGKCAGIEQYQDIAQQQAEVKEKKNCTPDSVRLPVRPLRLSCVNVAHAARAVLSVEVMALLDSQ